MLFDRLSRGSTLDDWDVFVPEHLPAPGPHLDGHDVLTGRAHVELHQRVRDVFERRGVYDAAYGYNLARLNLDRRYPEAGLRYAVAAGDEDCLRVAFTPTTAVCPETASLAPAILRATTEEEIGYGRVRVRVTPRYQYADRVNEALRKLEAVADERGSLPAPSALDEVVSDVEGLDG